MLPDFTYPGVGLLRTRASRREERTDHINNNYMLSGTSRHRRVTFQQRTRRSPVSWERRQGPLVSTVQSKTRQRIFILGKVLLNI